MTSSHNRRHGEDGARTREKGRAEAQPTSKSINPNSSTDRPLSLALRWMVTFCQQEVRS